MNYKNEILKKLLYNPSLRFSDLQLEGLTSKHFSYHLKKLVEEGLLVKEESKYFLTDTGKDYVGKLDESTMEKERQPKISVAIFVERDGK